MQNKKKLPLRTGVGVVVLNSNNEVFVAKRKDNPINKWQMLTHNIGWDSSPTGGL